MIVLVTGGRYYANAAALQGALQRLSPSLVIQGGASGADALARAWCAAMGVPCRTYEADWTKGRKAGPLRNQRMLDEGKPDVVLAATGGRGTADMIHRALKAHLRIIMVGA
jgi:YspA, cpYpsA-related SLOG family